MTLSRRRFIQLGLLQITVNQITGCDNSEPPSENYIESATPVIEPAIPEIEPAIQLTALTIDDTKTTIDSLSIYIGQ